MNQATAVATREEPQLTPFEVIEKVITSGDLAKMTPQERVAFYWRTCQSLGLNPLTRPFEFINLNGKLTMYARKDATDQLRKLNAVSVTGIRREKDDELGLVTVYATGVDKTGRTDEAEGVVSIKGLAGEALANALMKAATKAKRRLTLSLVGLGFLDESELPEGAGADVDPTTGEIVERAKPPTLLEAVARQKARMDSPDTSDEPAGPADAAAEADDTAAVAPTAGVDDVEWAGEAAVVTPDVDPAITLLERLRTNADASSMQGDMTQPQRKRLGEILGALEGPERARGVTIAFGEGAVRKLSAAQANAIAGVADAMGVEEFIGAWRAMLAAGDAA